MAMEYDKPRSGTASAALGQIKLDKPLNLMERVYQLEQENYKQNQRIYELENKMDRIASLIGIDFNADKVECTNER